MKEAEFQRMVIDLAGIYDWRVAHFRTVFANGRWLTPVAGDGAGFPDLVLAKPGHDALFAELKTDTGRLSPAQKLWANALPLVHVWRPRDWNRIEATLRGN